MLSSTVISRSPVGVDPRYLYADHEIVSLGENVGRREPLGPARRDATRTEGLGQASEHPVDVALPRRGQIGEGVCANDACHVGSLP